MERDDYAEIAGYVDAFRVSSDRSRRFIFVIVTVCVLLFIASWNLHRLSWSRIRMAKAAELRTRANVIAKAAALAGVDVAKVQSATLPTDSMYGRLVVEKYAEEYVKQMLVVHIPAVGISTDVNELGLLGGITLTLLMGLLLAALARQHENLYLCIFKIRRLFERDERRVDGESAANYLYHSLAMSQLLNMPPTLARWPSGTRKPFINAAVKASFLIPAALQFYVVWTNWTSGVPGFYKANPHGKLLVQAFFAILLAALAVGCVLLVRAMDKRWRGIFFYINPGHRVKDPTPRLIWLKLRSRWTRAEKELRLELEKALIDKRGTGGTTGDPLKHQTMKMRTRQDRLSREQVGFSSHHLMKQARAEALEWCAANNCEYVQLEGFELSGFVQADKRVSLTIEWWFRCTDDQTDDAAPATDTA
jgi:hypothetical protein